MLEHRFERTRIAAAHELEKTGRDLEAADVADAADVEQQALQRRQPASAFGGIIRPALPQPSRGVQRIEVRDAVERHLHAVEQPPRLHHRHVERLAVVSDNQLRIVEELGHGSQQRALGRIAREQELPDLEGAEVVEAAADEEGYGPGAAAQPCGFEIDEHRTPMVRRCEAWLEQLQTLDAAKLAVGDPHVAVPAVGLVAAIDDQAFAELVASRPPAEDFANAIDRRACLVATEVRFVGELANRP